MWNWFFPISEEISPGAYEIVPQDAPLIPENVLPEANSDASTNAEGSPDAEASNIENGEASSHNSCPETSENLPDSELGLGNEEFELISFATDSSKLPTGPIAADAEESPDAEDSNIENGEASPHNYCPETSENLPDSKIGLENEEFELISFATDSSRLPTGAIADDSNGEIRRRRRSLTDEDHQSSSEQNEVEVVPAESNWKKLLSDMAAFIGIFLSIMAIIFGAANIGHCPAESFLPYLTLVSGTVGLILVLYVLSKTGRENFDRLTENERIVIAYIFATILIWEVFLFFRMDASFDVSAENYCNFSFYVFIIILEVFSVLGFIVGLGLFVSIPEDRADSPTICDYMWMADF